MDVARREGPGQELQRERHRRSITLRLSQDRACSRISAWSNARSRGRQLDPGRLGRVVAPWICMLAGADDRRVGQRDRPAPRVAAGLRRRSRSARPGRRSPARSPPAARAGRPASAGSSISRKPPGIAHLPANGSRPRRIRRTRSDRSTRAEDDQVDRDRRTRVVIAVRGWHGMSACGDDGRLCPSRILASEGS